MADGSWGLSLFVLFEHNSILLMIWLRSWGLSLFVLFEHCSEIIFAWLSSWGLSLFVLFEHGDLFSPDVGVLED